MSHATIKALQERRANVFEGLKAALDKAEAEGRAQLTVEEQTDVDARNADLDALDSRVQTLTDALLREANIAASLRGITGQPPTAGAPAGPGTSEADRLRTFLRGDGGRSLEVRRDKPMTQAEFRSLSKLSAGAGANTVPTSFYDQLMAHLIEVAGLLQTGPTVLNTASGEALQIPKTTSHSTAALVTEGATIGASDPAFGQATLNAYKFGFLVQVSHELITDTAVDLEGYLAMEAGRALGNGIGTYFITGSGTSQPAGVVTGATTGVTGGVGVTGAFTADNLIDLFYSVIAPYRNSKSASWLMKDSTVGVARKLKDSQNRYLWEPSLQVGSPDTLLGKPVVTDPNVAAPALNAKSVVFGDFSKYFVRFVEGIRFEQSADFAFSSDLITFRALLRGDGILVDQTGAVKVFAGGAS